MNIKKMFTTLSAMVVAVTMTLPSASVFGATYSQELQDAYNWAHENGVTTMDSIDNANMYGAITRAQMAKMLSVYAEEIQGKTPDTSKACTFSDIDSVKGDLHDFIIESCQLGIMGQGISAFRPYDTISRAEFGTALSRVLWGNEYEGGTPYYAKHLDALKAAGIMTQIDNPENRDEVRGYVMLMLMRAAEGVEGVDCEDPAIALACAMETDECPAACRDNGEEDDNKVVKSGDLAVSAEATAWKKAILDGKVSDLDTITLKASEPITVNSITLERFGYSTADDVDAIWLEDGDGNKIADEKDLSTSKDTVTLKIKKEYREMDETNSLTIVLRTAKFTSSYSGSKVGSTIGFKVTDVDASAKNLDISDYTPYTYELATYAGSEITVSAKGNEKVYNYEEGEYYEVSRLKVTAGSSIISLNGVTLTNQKTGSLSMLDLEEFVSDVKVTADGKEVKGLKYNVTKDNELVLSWDTIEIEINKNVQLAVSIAMEGLDKFGDKVRLVVKEEGDVNAIEKKTWARVSVTKDDKDAASWKVYTFQGSKIKFSNTKISATVDAAQGSEDVVIAKGSVTVGEEVKLSELVFTASTGNVIDGMSLSIAGETYDASVTSGKTIFTFKNVYIEESGDLELTVDIVDSDQIVGENVSVTYKGASSITKSAFSGNNARYENSREYVTEDEVSGSISISKLKVQESKASLKNNNSKTVEFVKDETSDRTTVFKGTYTAKKADLTLKEFAIVAANAGVKSTVATGDTTAEFYLYINGEEVGMIDEDDIQIATGWTFDSYENFSDDVEVAAGESVSVEVKAVIAPTAVTSNINLDLYLRGEDKNGTAAGFAKAGLVTFKYALNGSLTVSDSATMSKKTVALQDNEIIMAKFTLKPSKSNSVKLDNMHFNLSGLATTVDKAWVDEHVTVEVDGTDVEVDDSVAFNASDVVFDATDVDDIEDEVEVIVKVRGLASATTTSGTYSSGDVKSLTLISVNGVEKNSTYSRLILPAIVTFDSQTSDGAVTKFRLNVDDYDGAQVSNVKVYTKTLTAGEGEAGTVTNWSVIEVSNQSTAEVVTKVTFDITEGSKVYNIVLTNADFADYFKTTDGTTLRVSKTSD